MTIKNNGDNKFSRRKFLQGGAILGATAGLAAISDKGATKDVVKALGKRELDEFPHETTSDFKRYYQTEERNITIMTALNMHPDGTFGEWEMDDSKPGITQLDHALSRGALSVEQRAGSKHGSLINSPLFPWDLKPNPRKYEFVSKEEASKAIKKAAKFYRADLVGITAYDERWVYGDNISAGDDGEINIITENDFPFKPKSVIVMAFEEDYEALSTTPSLICQAGVNMEYSRMGETSCKLTTFINQLGYGAFACGNDTAESVPYAIAAGLGEQGRNTILITLEYGPRVRLAKVFTDMELAYDKPIEFGANKFCQVCKKCAISCPTQSITYNDEMTYKSEFIHDGIVYNHEGVYKYYYDRLTCTSYTCNIDCSVCLTSCPYSKPDFWHHRMTALMTATPLKPFLKEMDDLMGYGNTFDEQASRDFWELDGYTK